MTVRLDSKVKDSLIERANEMDKAPAELLRGVVEYVSGAKIEELNELLEQSEVVAKRLAELRQSFRQQLETYGKMSAEIGYAAGVKKTPAPGFERE